jgi:hypothetical protein
VMTTLRRVVWSIMELLRAKKFHIRVR